VPGNTHAEQCAIDKLVGNSSSASSSNPLAGASIYTTMEPCSLRLSGNVPCVQRVLATGISKVYMGVEEPKDFVECEGTRMLREDRREVWVVDEPGLAEECLREARRGH
jgi:pyrimidine deaminase RibD-like protein